MGKMIPYEKVCYICGKKAERRSINRIWTGKYICICHYASDYYRDIEKNDQNSRNNALRAVRDRRTGNQDPNSTNAK